MYEIPLVGLDFSAMLSNMFLTGGLIAGVMCAAMGATKIKGGIPLFAGAIILGGGYMLGFDSLLR